MPTLCLCIDLTRNKGGISGRNLCWDKRQLASKSQSLPGLEHLRGDRDRWMCCPSSCSLVSDDKGRRSMLKMPVMPHLGVVQNYRARGYAGFSLWSLVPFTKAPFWFLFWAADNSCAESPASNLRTAAGSWASALAAPARRYASRACGL